MGRKYSGELLFNTKCRLDVGTSSVDGDGGPVEIDINGLINSEINGLVET
jgi:hypothetical protein